MSRQARHDSERCLVSPVMRVTCRSIVISSDRRETRNLYLECEHHCPAQLRLCRLLDDFRLDDESFRGDSVFGREDVEDIFPSCLAQMLVASHGTRIAVGRSHDCNKNVCLLVSLCNEILCKEVQMLHLLVVESSLSDIEIYHCRSHVLEEICMLSLF